MLKKTGINIISSAPLLRYKKGNRFIFYYHDISDPDSKHFSPIYSTETKEFKKHLKFYQKNFLLIGLDEILNDDLPKNKNYASITFDDSFSSVREVAFPLLNSEGIPISVFLNKSAIECNRLWISDLVLGLKDPGFIRRVYEKISQNDNRISFDSFVKEPLSFFSEHSSLKYIKIIQDQLLPNPDKIYLNREDIKFLSGNGVIIGNHTVNHYDLTKCPENIIKKEIKENADFLREITGKDSHHFAVPFGKKKHYNKMVLEIIKESGIKYVYTSNPVRLEKAGDKEMPRLIPRIGIRTDSVKTISFYINRNFFRTYDL